MVALSLATKLASSSAPLNAIGAEIALQLELHDIKEAFTAHTPGKLLVMADALSRMFSPAATVRLQRHSKEHSDVIPWHVIALSTKCGLFLMVCRSRSPDRAPFLLYI